MNFLKSSIHQVYPTFFSTSQMFRLMISMFLCDYFWLRKKELFTFSVKTQTIWPSRHRKTPLFLDKMWYSCHLFIQVISGELKKYKLILKNIISVTRGIPRASGTNGIHWITEREAHSNLTGKSMNDFK